MADFNEQFEIRKKKLEKLKETGLEPYPTKYEGGITVSAAVDMNEGETVRVAGRLMSRRMMGKAAFAHIKDSTGQIQFYLKLDKTGTEVFKIFKDMDIGDFLGVEGEIFITRTGEKTVLAENMNFLSKALRPLPEKFHKLKDVETRYRKRYLDILVNEDSSKILKARAVALSRIRELLTKKRYIEVETPILQDIPGGAAARPFITHHNVYDAELSLRIAPELYLKRLIVGGWDRVFEIGRNFRNEGVSTRHNPEFTMIEIYCAYTDYKYMMSLSKELISEVWEEVRRAGYTPVIDFSKGWEERNIWELLSHYSGSSISPEDPIEVLREKALKLDVPPGKDSSEKIVDRIFSKYVEPQLKEATFVTGYLSDNSPLAKRSPDDLRIAERFEIFAAGQEIGNAYSEQNDPIIQRNMFEMQVENYDDPEQPKKVDEDYLEALEYGMPPASGLGIGIDRLLMLMTGAESIREVILFPMLKPFSEE
ncbi:MAG: lysine--tRNA ligase [Elusimicrobiota bacterium]